MEKPEELKEKKNPYWGSTLNDFLEVEGIKEELRAIVLARIAKQDK